MFLQETFKMFTRPYAKIVLLVLFILMTIFSLSFAFEGKQYYDSFITTFGKGVEFEGKLINGNMFAYQLFHSLWLFVPLLVVVVTGGMISEERSEGTLRMVLSRKVSKSGFFTARFIAAKIYVLIIVLFMAVLSIGVGLLIFGSGELLTYENGKFAILTANHALIRFVIAYGFYFLVLLTVASLSLLFSVLYNNSIKAIIVTVSVILILYFISSLEIPFFDDVKPFLFTSYFSTWSQFFGGAINWMGIAFDAIVLVVHILLFYVLALVFFNKKEILD